MDNIKINSEVNLTDVKSLFQDNEENKILRIGIYCFRNILNEKRYIGLSNNIERRYNEHRLGYYAKKNISYDSKFYRALRKYGFNNFLFSIQELCLIEELEKREEFWINYYNSMNNGYNMTSGGLGNVLHGELNPMSKLTQKQVDEIYHLLSKTNTPQILIAQKYQMSPMEISSISNGKRWRQDGYEYPLREHSKTKEGKIITSAKITNEIADEIRILLSETTFSQQSIADYYHIKMSTVTGINSGKHWNIEMDYPIRKEISENGQNEKGIKNTITKFINGSLSGYINIETGKIFLSLGSILEWTGVSITKEALSGRLKRNSVTTCGKIPGINTDASFRPIQDGKEREQAVIDIKKQQIEFQNCIQEEIRLFLKDYYGGEYE